MAQAWKDRLYRLLRWSERYARLDMVYLASGSFWIGIGLISNTVSSFASALLFGNLLPKDIYGIYKYVLTLASMLGNLSLTGLRTALNRSAALGYDGDLRRGFWLNLRWSALLVLGSYAVALYYFGHGNFEIGAGLLAFGSLSPLLNASNLYSFYLNGARRFRQENLYSIGRDWLPLLCLAPTLLLTHNVALISLVYFAANAGSAALFYWRTVRRIPDPSPTSPALMSYSAHLSAMSLLAGILGQADNLLVFHYLGAAELAVYSFASAIPSQFQNASKLLYTLALPKFSGKTIAEARAGIYLRIAQALALGLAGTAAYFLAAPYIFSWFFPRYLDAVPYTQLLSFTILLSATGSITSVYFDSQLEVRKKYVITMFANLSKLALMVVFLHWFGITGIIIGILISWVLTFLVQMVLIATDR